MSLRFFIFFCTALFEELEKRFFFVRVRSSKGGVRRFGFHSVFARNHCFHRGLRLLPNFGSGGAKIADNYLSTSVNRKK